MKQNHFSIYLLSGLAFLSSCAADSLDGPGHGPNDSVSFSTSVPTRGTPIDDASDLSSLGVFCSYTGGSDWTAADAPGKMFNQRLNQSGGTWGYPAGEEVYWGASNLSDRYTFFAYAPYAEAGNGIAVTGGPTTPGVPKLTYTVPTNCVDQPDLMVAVPRKDLRPTGSPVALVLKHALTCVGFQIAGNGEQIKGLAVKGVSVTGTLSVDGGTIGWTNLGPATATDFSASLNPASLSGGVHTTTPTMTTNLLAGNGYLMMIPQALTASAKLVITKADDTEVEIALGTHPWAAGEKVIYNVTLVPGGTITVAPSTLTLPYTESSGSFVVTCDDGSGNDAPGLGWTLAVPSGSWLTLANNAAGTGKGTTLSGTGSQTVYVFARENASTTADRTVNVTLGGATQVTVTQIRTLTGGGTAPAGITTYVGAFWRASQKGERVIKIDVGTNAGNLGGWSASVVYMDGQWGTDGIVLKAGDSDDPNIRTASHADAEDYPVTEGSPAITGTVAANGSILFRIGLTNTWSAYNEATKPARYAVVLLSYNNNTKHQKIYLRQGEGPDEVVPGSGIKWSPYNLRAPGNITTHTLLSTTNRPVFTDFPTQGGHYFKWNSLYAIPFAAPYATSEWNDITYNSGTFNPANDPCHLVDATVTYMTPTVGRPITSLASLGLSSGAMATGYYSDGHTDRRAWFPVNIGEAHAGGQANEVCLRGSLFSSDDDRSTFFPYSSRRGPVSESDVLGMQIAGAFHVHDSWYPSVGNPNVTIRSNGNIAIYGGSYNGIVGGHAVRCTFN